MSQRFLILAAFALITLLGYFQFPGHTYLQSDTQIYIPILERLRDPDLYKADPVALRPHVSYTIYDEVALALRRLTGLDFEWVLAAQQLVFRFLGIWGVYLIATSMGLQTRMAVVVASIVHLGASIHGPAVLTVEYEPVPRGFAIPLIILAIGLLAHNRTLPAAAVAGLAILFHPPTVVPFLAVYGIMLLRLPDAEERRRRWQYLLPILGAAALLFVFSKLQAGLSEKQDLFGRIDAELERLQRLRGAYNWVSLWAVEWIWQYLFLWVAGVIAFLRMGRWVPEKLQFFVAGLPAYGLLMIPVSYLTLEGMKWSFIPQFQPARAVLFVVLMIMITGSAAGLRAAQARRWLEAVVWLVIVFAIPVNIRVLPILFPNLTDPVIVRRLLLTLGLAGLAVLAAVMEKRRGAWATWAACLILPCFLIPHVGGIQNFPELHHPELDELAAWARENTPQDAVFLFPFAERSLHPGVFRARSLRTVYVDWKSGGQVNLLKDFADEWWQRWQAAMARPGSKLDLASYARLGIDFIVVERKDALPEVQTVFANSRYAVYGVPR
jgi:hypothetical protein